MWRVGSVRGSVRSHYRTRFRACAQVVFRAQEVQFDAVLCGRECVRLCVQEGDGDKEAMKNARLFCMRRQTLPQLQAVYQH